MKWKLLLFLTTLSFFAGCDLRKREEALQKKETELSRREQELAMKEKTLSSREDELINREKVLDSVLALDSTRLDSTIVYDSTLIGRWSVKMTCTETTCPGSAVGDTKSEIWDFSYQGNQLIVTATAGTEIVRVYEGTRTKEEITLVVDVPGTPSAPATKIWVRLSVREANTMEGQREILRGNECKIIYALQLSKQ